MYHDLPRSASFWAFLFSVDQDLAASSRQKACSCGGRLHCANYPRKPRGGGDDLPEQYGYRLSFCCDRDGCRKRVTPPSVRFLGRKVYLGAVVVLVAAMRQGPAPRRVRELSRLFGADRRTIARWQVFWREHVPQTPFWKVARGRLVPPVEILALPLSLLDAFLRGDDAYKAWERLLCFLAPITIAGGLVSQLSG
ncbi:MAG TPA: hypothetical protein VMK12_32350 [Anaeromyxobacteraceae bacterium]|nr:hypothetical protein [Anaeromyxobacteraceae bacterium]